MVLKYILFKMKGVGWYLKGRILKENVLGILLDVKMYVWKEEFFF